MRDDVVQLAGDPPALVGDRLVGKGPLVLLGHPGPLLQGQDGGPPGVHGTADEEADQREQYLGEDQVRGEGSVKSGGGGSARATATAGPQTAPAASAASRSGSSAAVV
ncbi:hypothetical protein GCM10027615_52930 [Plantactinospora veratri]